MPCTKQTMSLALAFLANQALGLSVNHRHAHRHLHKKDLYIETEITTVTSWTTMYVYDDEVTSSASAASSFFKGDAHSEHYSPLSSSSTLSPPSTTLATSTSVAVTTSTTPAAEIPSPQETLKEAAAVVPTSSKVTPAASTPVIAESVAVAITAPKPAPTPTKAAESESKPAPAAGGLKRGLAYNDGSLLSAFLGDKSKCDWSYNWGQVQDGGAPKSLEYVPMMWGPTHLDTWPQNAEKAIANGAKNFLSFNECDHPNQCNMKAPEAAEQHKKIMNQYSDKVRISTPAITNSGAQDQGISWLQEFLDACNGECKYDFCAAHWYSPPDADEFLDHLTKVHEVCGKPVWVTEFAPIEATDEEINAFLGKVMDAMDNDPKYSFVERYAYFWVQPGSLISSGKTPSLLGNSFAFS